MNGSLVEEPSAGHWEEMAQLRRPCNHIPSLTADALLRIVYRAHPRKAQGANLEQLSCPDYRQRHCTSRRQYWEPERPCIGAQASWPVPQHAILICLIWKCSVVGWIRPLSWCASVE